jgi:hypothetical protein
MHLSTHPDTIRPDHSAGAFVPNTPFPLESPDIASRMAAVILRQANDGQATELRHFTESAETRGLTPDEIATNLGAARRIADRKVIRQDGIEDDDSAVGRADAFPAAGRTEGQESEPPPSTVGARAAQVADELAGFSNDELLVSALPLVTQILTGDVIVTALHSRGFSPSQISRIWPDLTVKAATEIAKLDRPSIGHIARVAREAA